MRFYDLITDEHSHRLPYVRIKRIELENVKSVKHGVLALLGDEVIPCNTRSNILGVYGQNGSGKSAIVEALNLIKGLIGGYIIPPRTASFIDFEKNWAVIKVEFEFQYRDGVVASVEYSVKLTRKKKNGSRSDPSEEDREEKETIVISEEVIKTDMYADGIKRRRHTIVDTKECLLCSDACIKDFFGSSYDDGVKQELVYYKRKSADDSRSFVFSPDFVELIHNEGINSKYTEILSEISNFATKFLFVIGTRSNAIAQLRARVPLFMPSIEGPVLLNGKEAFSAGLVPIIEREFNKVNSAISTIIPELSLELEKIPTRTEEGKKAFYLNLLSVRGDRKIPFEYESDGIVKIVSILACYIFAFNQGSSTLVVDEFDAGVFEYLLGELLQIFEHDGKGQLIFTSHNLRPLEVLDKSCICFTTSDPDNRYCRLKNISSTNNLRDQYLKTVQMGNTETEFYKKTKEFKIVKALKQAGGDLRQ